MQVEMPMLAANCCNGRAASLRPEGSRTQSTPSPRIESEFGQWQNALLNLAMLHKSGPGQNHVKPNAHAISACGKGRQWQQALGLLAVMRESDLVPGVITYSAAISACEKGDQWQQALGLLAVTQKADLVPKDDSAAISACEKREQWQQALVLLAVMQKADLVPNGTGPSGGDASD